MYKRITKNWLHLRRRTEVTARYLQDPLIVELRHDLSHTLTERERCQLLLDFANEGRLPDAAWCAILGGVTSETLLEPALRMVRESLELRIALPKLKGRERAGVLSRSLTWWALQVGEGGIIKLPLPDVRSGTFLLEDRVQAPDKMTGLAYAMCLLWDSKRPEGDALARCRYCGTFFFVERPESSGRPRREYCSDKHRDLRKAEGNTARVARYRIRKRKGLV